MFAVSSPYGRRAARLRQATSRLAGSALLAGLVGCGSNGPLGRPLGSAVDFYHGLEGGAIAGQRPPPPGADDPYPNLGAIPARPPAPDITAQQRIADRLAAQRDAAEADASKSPLAAAPSRPPPAPPKPSAAPDPNANRVVVDAAAAPPVPQAPAPPAASPGPELSAVPAVPAAIVSGPVPSLAAAPPALPPGLGVSAPPVVQAAAASAPAPANAPDPPKPPANTVLIAFTPGSASLPPSAPLNLRRFALAHKGVPVTVTGHGEAVLPGADPQSRALDLALRRAQAIAASLAQAGIPASNLRMRAEAAGQGGSATL